MCGYDGQGTGRKRGSKSAAQGIWNEVGGIETWRDVKNQSLETGPP